NASFSGTLNTANNELVLNADVPQFSFQHYSFDDIKLAARGNRDSLFVSGETGNFMWSDSLNVPHANFRISARNDSSRVAITTGTTQGFNQANLNALVLTYDDGA